MSVMTHVHSITIRVFVYDYVAYYRIFETVTKTNTFLRNHSKDICLLHLIKHEMCMVILSICACNLTLLDPIQPMV